MAFSLGLLAPWPGLDADGLPTAQPVVWTALPAALQERLTAAGLDREGLGAWLIETRARHAARVRQGDEDHLAFYALQTTRTTTRPPIEPAVSAMALVGSLDEATRARFLADPLSLPPARVPAGVRARLHATMRALERDTSDARLRYFQDLVPAGSSRADADTLILHAYLRAMRFLYEQQEAGKAADAAAQIATLYRTRGLSTDTSVEAGFLVHQGLATLKALDPARRLQHVVIVGPGLDLAPRTGLVDGAPPQSLQPFAVADALVGLGLAERATLRLTCLDINPRVVSYLGAAGSRVETLVMTSGVAESPAVTLTDDYRAYFTALGASIGAATEAPPLDDRYGRRLRRTVRLRAGAAGAIEAARLDIVVERLALQADAVIVTNVLPYFDDRELALALANIAAMLAPSGVLVHNEARAGMGDITSAVGLTLLQARTAIIATVRGAPPAYDGVWIHEKRAR